AAFAAATIAQSDQWKTGWVATRMSWCAYFTPFMFAYSPELILQGDLLAIALRLAVCMAGIFMGTLAGVGHFPARVALPYRIAYGVIALMLLAQPNMFDGAIWLNIIGMIAAVASTLREFMRARAPLSVAPSG